MDEILEEDIQKDKYMTFKTGDEYYAISIECVNEIIGFQSITSVPETEDYIKGLINLRGKIVPVIDVRVRFKLPPLDYTDRTCIIVIRVKATVVGLLVETIADVVTIEEENIVPPPSLGQNNKAKNKYVYGIGKVGESVKLLLDPDKLINDTDVDIFEELVTDKSNDDMEGAL